MRFNADGVQNMNTPRAWLAVEVTGNCVLMRLRRMTAGADTNSSMSPSRPSAAISAITWLMLASPQGLTLVHFSAQRKHSSCTTRVRCSA